MSEPIRDILAATDLSAAAETACTRAALIAAAHGALRRHVAAEAPCDVLVVAQPAA